MEETVGLSIGIIGSGRMGTDIFYYLSDYGFPMTWVCQGEVEKESLETSFMKKLNRRKRNDLIDEASYVSRTCGTRITGVLQDLSGCDIIIEAIEEDEEAKSRLFIELERYVSDDAVITTNTSSIRPSRLIPNSGKGDRFAGLHFFYPVKYKNIAELIVTDQTSGKTLEVLRSFLSSIGRHYLEMHERDGFILNRIFLDFQAEAYRLYDEGSLSMKAIDAMVKRELFPAGVFEFFDGVGIDVIYRSVMNYTENVTDKRFYLPLIRGLESLNADGRLGKKSGAGFYEYRQTDKEEDNDCGDLPDREIVSRLACLYINSAFRALEKNICNRNDLEYAIREYLSVEKGPFASADEIGRALIRDNLLKYFHESGFDAYRPSMLL